MAANDNKGKGAALFVLGGALGGALGAALSARPAQAATTTDTERLEYIATLLELLNKNELAVIAAIQGINITIPTPGGGEIVVPTSVLTPWIGQDPVQIYQQAIRNVGNFTSDHMIDMRNAKRLLIKAESSFDQAVIIQLVGNDSDTFNLATNVGGPHPLPVNGNLAIGLAWDDWHPYIGVTIAVAVPPTTGLITIRQSLQV